MSYFHEFCLRGFSECPSQHPMQMQEQEDPREYMSRMTEFWKERFASFGTAYLLPHHFLDMSALLLYCRELQESPFSVQEIFYDFATGVSQGLTYTDKEPVEDKFPIVHELPGNFSIPYNEDVLGPDSKNRTEYSLANAAASVAIITENSSITIGTDHRFDPVCFMAGTFGGGTHCLASSIDNFQGISVEERRGDIKLIGQMIEVIHENKLLSAGFELKEDKTSYGSRIKMSKAAFFGTSGMTLVTQMAQRKQKEIDEDFERRWKEYKVTNT